MSNMHRSFLHGNFNCGIFCVFGFSNCTKLTQKENVIKKKKKRGWNFPFASSTADAQPQSLTADRSSARCELITSQSATILRTKLLKKHRTSCASTFKGYKLTAEERWASCFLGSAPGS